MYPRKQKNQEKGSKNYLLCILPLLRLKALFLIMQGFGGKSKNDKYRTHTSGTR